VIEVRDLVKRYGTLLAVDRVSFAAAPGGGVLGLLGPNGAGKSTIMRILAGFLTPTEGTATVAGFPAETHSMEVRERVGYLPESGEAYPELRVVEYLSYRAALKRIPRSLRRAKVDRALEACGLVAVRRRVVGQLSKGYRQRVRLAAALLDDPPVLILDEPTVGLDPLQVREIRGLVSHLAHEHAVLFSTHVLSEAEAVCDQVVIVDQGRVLAQGSPRELASRFDAHSLSVELYGDADGALRALAAVAGLQAEIVARSPTVRLAVHGERTAEPEVRAAIARSLAGADCLVVELAPRSFSLDDVFARVTDGSKAP